MIMKKEQVSQKFLEIFLENNSKYLRNLRGTGKKFLFALRPRMGRAYAEYLEAETPGEKNAACAQVLNAYEEGIYWIARRLAEAAAEDLKLFLRFRGHRKVIDHSDRNVKDYYSVAVVLKNEARYIKEYILFYRATGADRIYLYDNGSEDGLMEEIRPFLDSGFVVYRQWPGRVVQTAGYRDAVRRARNRTKWLALIDADEFLFSPKGKMPEQLRAYEQYPGVGVNWVMYGPNGHDRRPEGLMMDNYTTTFEDRNSAINCHIKSIVQPKRVLCVFQPHYSIYRGRQYAVDEDREPIDNYSSFRVAKGRAFTSFNHRDTFRINHYYSKSVEDAEEKSRRGYPDGSPKKSIEKILRPFEDPLVEDYTIKPYADIVRAEMRAYE